MNRTEYRQFGFQLELKITKLRVTHYIISNPQLHHEKKNANCIAALTIFKIQKLDCVAALFNNQRNLYRKFLWTKIEGAETKDIDLLIKK